MTSRTLTTIAALVGIGALLATGVALAQGPMGRGMGQGGGPGMHQAWTGPGAEKMNELRAQHHADMQAQLAENGWTCPGYGLGNGPTPEQAPAPTETPTK